MFKSMFVGVRKMEAIFESRKVKSFEAVQLAM